MPIYILKKVIYTKTKHQLERWSLDQLAHPSLVAGDFWGSIPLKIFNYQKRGETPNANLSVSQRSLLEDRTHAVQERAPQNLV